MEARRAVRRIAVVIAVYLAVSVALGIFIAEATLHPGRRSVSSGDLVHAHDLATSLRAELSDATVTVIDGTSLRGWLLRPQQPNGDAVILLHGLSDNRLGMIGYAELLLRDNYTVLMIDARAHGQSEGLLATYGILESSDVHSWYEWLHDTQHPGCIFGFGESMGAAQLLQSVRESRFCSIAVESPFSNFREIGYDRVGQFFHTGPWLGRTILRPVIDFAFVYPAGNTTWTWSPFLLRGRLSAPACQYFSFTEEKTEISLFATHKESLLATRTLSFGKFQTRTTAVPSARIPKNLR